MVLTRTGKSTCHEMNPSAVMFSEGSTLVRKGNKRSASSKTTSSSSSNKTSFDIFIEAPPTELDDIEVGIPSPSTKKPRVLAESTNVHLNAIPIEPSAIVKDVKKVSISNEEKAMNGAPEGDLYDVVLLEDSALQAFESQEKALEELTKQLQAFTNTTVWAEKYEIITTFRRIVLHHTTLLVDSTMMKSVLHCILDSIASLRSSNVRNGLLCLKKASHLCDQLWSIENTSAIFTSLLNKSGNGPKFLCDTAFETAQIATEKCPIERLVPAVQPFLTHKNMEVSCKAIQLLAQSIMQSSTEYFQQLLQHGSVLLTAILSCLATGLNAKKALGKDKAKDALRHIKDAVGDDVFDTYLDTKLTSTQSFEIKREMKPKVAGEGVVASSSSSSMSSTPISSFKAKVAAVGVSATTADSAPIKKPWEKTPVVSSAPKPWEKKTVAAAAPKPWLKPTTTTVDPIVQMKPVNTNNVIEESLLPAVDALKELDALL